MPVKLERKCSRCRRDDSVTVESAAEAVAAEELMKKRTEKAKEIEAYLAAVPPELKPDVLVAVKGMVKVHVNVCDQRDAKRSCLKRATDLATELDQYDERAPRVKKAAEASPAA